MIPASLRDWYTGSLLNQLAQRIKGEEGRAPLDRSRLSGQWAAMRKSLNSYWNKNRQDFVLEDPHVARQHEADIQLLERAVRTVTISFGGE